MPAVPLTAAIVLAAGQGTRMRSATPKVLHRIAGRTLLGHALAAVDELSPATTVVVVRHDRDRVAAHVGEVAPAALVADQDEVPGTGRAFSCALAVLDGGEDAARSGRVLVTYGDVPLIRPETLTALLEADPSAAVSVLTAVVDDPTGYGRIVRDGDGAVVAIVEHRDADADVRAVREVNSGLYALDLDFAREAVAKLRPGNAAGELYLTDLVGIARAEGRRVTAVVAEDPLELEGVNDRVQLAAARRRLNDRLLTRLMISGVDVVDPATTWVDVTVDVAPDAVLQPGTQLLGATSVATGAVVGPDSTLTDSTLGEGASVVRSHVTGASIGAGAAVGPFTFVRPGTVLHAGAKVGAYVETKNAEIGEGAKVPHLSYVGDAVVGRGANIGAGTIVANYDGVAKHRTVVGEHVRIGSNTVLVAPVTVGDGAYSAAGSVVDADVPAGALAVGRGRLHVSEDWVARKRPGSLSADAAERAKNRHNGAVRTNATHPTASATGSGAGTSAAAASDTSTVTSTSEGEDA